MNNDLAKSAKLHYFLIGSVNPAWCAEGQTQPARHWRNAEAPGLSTGQVMRAPSTGHKSIYTLDCDPAIHERPGRRDDIRGGRQSENDWFNNES